MMQHSPCELPNCVFWNMHYFSVNSQEKWSSTINNLISMLETHKIIALSETHVEDPVEAESLFFSHSVGSRKIYGKDVGFVVEEQ